MYSLQPQGAVSVKLRVKAEFKRPDSKGTVLLRLFELRPIYRTTAKQREYDKRITAYLALMSETSRKGIQSQILKSRLPKGVMHRPRSLSNDPLSVPSSLSRTYIYIDVDVSKAKDKIKHILTSRCNKVLPEERPILLQRLCGLVVN
jgi:hypothetical protein